MAEVLEKVSLLQQFQQDRRSGQDREIIGIVLGQLLYHPMTNPAYVSLVLDDVARKWHEYLDRLEVLIESAAGQENVELMTCVVDERLATPPDKQSALPHFVDEYVFELEEHDDWPDDERARLWFAHAKRLAPGPSDPQQQGRPVWTRPRSMRR